MPAGLPTRAERRQKLATQAPIYARLLDNQRAYHAWLERPENLLENYRYSAFTAIWQEDFLPAHDCTSDSLQHALQQFRQKMALRIAYRDINALSSVENTLHELSLLAEVCVQVSCSFLHELWRRRLGIPMNDDTQQRSRFCILGMGKLGGRELNFWSDIDLVYLYDGEGSCHKQGKATAVTTREYYHRFFQDLSSFLNTLYRVDLRLRPEGESGPITRSLAAMESYYWSMGQSWERLAFIRARPIAGDTALGAELLEQLTPFTYPRFPQPSIFQEIASFKLRIEREVVGTEQLDLNIKSGFGGIREIEYQVQVLQIAQGGRNPFLQTSSVLEALEQFVKYSVLPVAKARFLRKTYLILRHIENRLQMRDERPVHTLPIPGSEREQLATGLGYPSARIFIALLDTLCEQVRNYYLDYFATDDTEYEVQQWTLLFTGHAADAATQAKIERWFPNEDNTTERLLKFARGAPQHMITREQVLLFIDITRYFDALLPQLATPMTTLERVAHFAESYGSRKHFFKTATNQHYFRMLCLLFDCSPFVYKLLCRHPEIMEALLDESPSREKTIADSQREISKLPQDETFAQFLWLYVKAEQVRCAMGELSGRIGMDTVEQRLTTLADATIGWVLQNIDPAGHLAIIALGKYGGRQLGFGSDLDILVIGEQNACATDQPLISQLIKILHHQCGLGHTLTLDFRLRPHGDHGPLVTTMHALSTYHTLGHAQPWEKQMLTKYRAVAGNPELIQDFAQFVKQLIYRQPITEQETAEIYRMRLKAEPGAKSLEHSAQRALKTGPGGIMDVDFIAQLLQLKFGHTHPSLQVPNTCAVLQAAAKASLIAPGKRALLLSHYASLRRVDFYLRRLEFTPTSTIPAHPEIENALAKWMHFGNSNAMHLHVGTCMQTIRQEFNYWFDTQPLD